VRQNWKSIKYIENPGMDSQYYAIRENPDAILYLLEKNISIDINIQRLAVQGKGSLINDFFLEKGLEIPEFIQLSAVYQDGTCIYYIDNPSEYVQLTAVRQNGLALRYIKSSDISINVQMTAVKKNGMAIRYLYEKNIPVSEEVQLEAVTENPSAICFIPNPSEKIISLANAKDRRCNYDPPLGFIY
jgi:hypothetical protein